MGSKTPGTGRYRQFMQVELFGIRLAFSISVKQILGCREYPRTGSQSIPVINLSMWPSVIFPSCTSLLPA